MPYKNHKVHLQVKDVKSICGVHSVGRAFAWSEDLKLVTCGNCLRKFSVFKWSPENPRRMKEKVEQALDFEHKQTKVLACV